MWAPWYTLHKIMAGLLGHHRLTGDTQALRTVIDMAGWVDWRTARLSQAQMRSTLDTEFGGMNAVLAGPVPGGRRYPLDGCGTTVPRSH